VNLRLYPSTLWLAYGSLTGAGELLRVDRDAIERLGVRPYFAKVNPHDLGVLTTTSRSIGLFGIADTVSEAEQLVERALEHIKGDYLVRHDIGRIVSPVEASP
jgi:phosphoribosylamine--glycine ligase